MFPWTEINLGIISKDGKQIKLPIHFTFVFIILFVSIRSSTYILKLKNRSLQEILLTQGNNSL